jgi:hypothetical protein
MLETGSIATASATTIPGISATNPIRAAGSG